MLNTNVCALCQIQNACLLLDPASCFVGPTNLLEFKRKKEKAAAATFLVCFERGRRRSCLGLYSTSERHKKWMQSVDSPCKDRQLAVCMRLNVCPRSSAFIHSLCRNPNQTPPRSDHLHPVVSQPVSIVRPPVSVKKKWFHHKCGSGLRLIYNLTARFYLKWFTKQSALEVGPCKHSTYDSRKRIKSRSASSASPSRHTIYSY